MIPITGFGADEREMQDQRDINQRGPRPRHGSIAFCSGKEHRLDHRQHALCEHGVPEHTKTSRKGRLAKPPQGLP